MTHDPTPEMPLQPDANPPMAGDFQPEPSAHDVASGSSAEHAFGGVEGKPTGESPDSGGLVGIHVGVGRALLAAAALVAVTDLVVGGAALLLRSFGGVPGWARGLVLSALVVAGYLAGLVVAVRMTRRPGATLAESYGFRGLTPTIAVVAIGVAFAARVFGGFWAAVLLGFKIRLPGMNVDPTTVLGTGPLSVVLTFALFAGLAPFVEELGFRGILLGTLSQRMTFVWANLISAFLFAALHLNLWAAVPVFVAALGFGWLFRNTRTLWAPIVAHAAFNAIGLALAYASRGLGPV